MLTVKKYQLLLSLQFFFAISIFTETAFAQKESYKVYSSLNGLPGGYIESLFADNEGYLWISSFADLLRFDGNTFTKFNSTDGLPSQRCFILYEDHEHTLWGISVLNNVSQVIRFLNGKFETLPFDKNDSVQSIFSFYETPNNNFFVCTNRGVFERKNNSWQIRDFGLNKNIPPVINFIELPDHSLIFCTNWYILHKYADGRIQTIADTSLHTFFYHIQQVNNNFLIRCPNHLYVYDGKKIQPFADNVIKDHYILGLFVDHLGRVYLSLDDNRFLMVDNNTITNFHVSDSASNGFLKAICEDREGNIWFGKLNLLRLRFSAADHFEKKDGLKTSDTRSVFVDAAGNIYFGAASDGFTIWNQHTFISSTVLLPQYEMAPYHDQFIYGFAEDGNHSIWMKTNANKIFRFSNNKAEDIFKINPQRKRINDMIYDTANGCMLLAIDSLYKIKDDKIAEKIAIIIHNKKEQPLGLCFDNKHRLWLSASNGFIGYMNVATKQFYWSEKISNNIQPGHLICASDGTIWASTSIAGVLHFTIGENGEIKQLRSINQTDGLPSNFISDMAFDKSGWLWIVTVDGVTRFMPSKTSVDCKIIHQEFGDDDGLNAESYVDAHIAVDNNNNVWISTYSGVYHFLKGYAPIDSLPPKLHIEKVNFLNDSSGGVKFAKTCTQYFHLPVNPVLPYDKNTVTIYFNCIAYSKQNEVECEYKLEGLENNWSSSGLQKAVSYANLPAGDYTFHVRARRKNFAWNEEEKFAFSIKPPYWQTWWFITLCAIVSMCILYFIYRIRLNRLLAIERTRTRIARDLHDDIGSTLTSISYFSTAAKLQLENKEENSSMIMLDKIGESSRSMINSMNDIVWAINPKNDQLEDLIARMKYYASETLGERDIQYYFSIKENEKGTKLKMEMRKNYFLIFKEAIHNIVKYANCKTVNIILEHDHQNLILIIKDDGVGFEKGEVTGEGNGMQNMQQRADEISAQLIIESSKRNGSTITLISKIT